MQKRAAVLTGDTRLLPLPDLIQVNCLNAKTGHLRVRSGDVTGDVYFEKGEIVHAQFGEIIGERAVYAILNTQEIRFDFETNVQTHLRSVNESWRRLLMEAARLEDEGSAPRATGTWAVAAAKRKGLSDRLKWIAIGGGALLALIAVATVAWMLVKRPASGASAAQATPALAAAPTQPSTPAQVFEAVNLAGSGSHGPELEQGSSPRSPVPGLNLAPSIVVRLRIDTHGRVADSSIYRSRLDLRAFEDAALEAVKTFRFKPATKDGQPVESWLNLPVTFQNPSVNATVRVKGSDTIGGSLGPALAKKFMADNASTQVSVEALGSSTAFQGLFDGSADLGASSRPINEKELARAGELGLNLREWVLGYDGIAVIVHPGNPVKSLNIAQLSDIFTGKVTNWRDVGGADAPIKLVTRPTYSGTHGFFKEKVLRRGEPKGSEEFASSAEVIEENHDIVARIAGDAGAVGYVGMGSLTSAVRAVPVALSKGSATVMPDKEVVRNGTYPIYRPLLVYTVGIPRGESHRFLEFALSSDGQDVVEQQGFVGSGMAQSIPAEGKAQADSEAREAERIFFPQGAVELSPQARKTLLQVGRTLKKEGLHVQVVGNSDSMGAASENEKMAVARAQAVAAFLRDQARVPPEQIDVASQASDLPLASNTSAAGRAQNRRVDLFVLKP